MKDRLCPCCSGKMYSDCCKKFHDGVFPEKAEQLMRSRYSAYALGLVDYILETTHRLNPYYNEDRDVWRKSVKEFSESIDFVKLEIVDFKDGAAESFVTFIASLKKKKSGEDVSFCERSRFVKSDGRWLYRDGFTSTLA